MTQTQYQSLVDLAMAVESTRAKKRDLIADTRHLTLEENGNLSVAEDSFPVNDYAHNQIATRLGIPRQYYDRMRATEPGLLAHNVNTWFSRSSERRMVRTLDGNVRAFLSDRYQRIENEEVLATILPVLKEIPDLEIRSLALTERKFYLKATVASVTGEVKKGDVVEAGIEISNGEIGNGAFLVNPYALRLICLNGMKMPVGNFRKNHVGARADVSDEVYEMLTDETRMADDKAFLLKARDVVRATLSETGFHKMLTKMQASTEDRLEGNPAEAIEVLGDKLGLVEQERGNVLRHLIEGGDLSRWGVINAVTRSAQDATTYDRSDELEGFGGKLIEFTKSDWKELAIAA